jgi:hypothetical protein
LIEEGGYCAQVFNIDETALFCKKMPARMFLATKKTVQGHKPAKDRLTPLLGGNASGD